MTIISHDLVGFFSFIKVMFLIKHYVNKQYKLGSSILIEPMMSL